MCTRACCRKLYWVDSKHKTLDSVNFDGSGRRSVQLGAVVGTGHVYGLTIHNNKAYISGWKSNVSMIQVQLPSGTPQVFKSGLSSGAVFSNAYVSASQQPTGTIISFLNVCRQPYGLHRRLPTTFLRELKTLLYYSSFLDH